MRKYTKKVSAVCCTYGRFKCVERVMNFYLAQIYDLKELIIFNTDMDSLYLEDERLNGYKFAIQNAYNRGLGSCKKYIQLLDPSTIKFQVIEGVSPYPIVYMETYGEVHGYDEGMPEPMSTFVYIIKDGIIKDSIIGAYSNLYEIVLNNSLIGNDAEVKGVSRNLNIGDNTAIDLGGSRG